MSYKAVRLKKEARAMMMIRGHKPGRFVASSKLTRQIDRPQYTCSCLTCGMSVQVISYPLPNEVKIGGEAVAMNCKEFSVVEHTSHFCVRHNLTGLERPMGDGVDAISFDNGKAMSPGDSSFVSTWEACLNADPDETRAAYFPDLK